MLTIVIADDEMIARKTLKFIIEKNIEDASVVSCVDNGVDLVQEVRKKNPDIAIVDINMPGMTGLEAIDLLSSFHVKTRFIINTAYEEFDFARKAIGLQAQAYLLKPESQDQVVEAIRRVQRSVEEEKNQAETRSQIDQAMSRLSTILENEIMSSIFLGKADEESFRQYCSLQSADYHGAVMISLFLREDTSPDFSQKSYVQIRDCLEQTLRYYGNYLFRFNTGSICILLWGTSFSDNWQETLADVLTVVLDRIRKLLGQVPIAGVGVPVKEFSKMPYSYQTSLRAYTQGSGNIRFFRERADSGAGVCAPERSSPSRRPSESQPLNTRNPYVLYAVRYIDGHYNETFSLEDVAQGIGLSAPYLSRLFSQETGMTFVEYLNQVRMEHGIRLIRETNLSVSEIAQKCGYSGAGYFTRVLKKYTGMSFSEIRSASRLQDVSP